MGEPPPMKCNGRNLLFLWILVSLVPAGSTQTRAQAQDGSGAQSASEGGDSAAAKAARKQKFEAMKKRMELGEEGAGSLDEGDEGGGVMRIVSVTRRVNMGARSRGATESLQVVYELETELSQGSIEVMNGEGLTTQYLLPSLKSGRHTMTIPQGLPQPNYEYTFSCDLEGSHYSGITIMPGNLWDNRDRDSSDTNYPGGEDESVYAYKPGPEPDEPKDPPPDEAAAFRGDEVGVSSFVIPAKKNRARRSVGKLMEIQILGVGFSEGHAVVCSKQIGGQPQSETQTRVHDVRVVSTASHQMNEDMPVLKAGRFNVPEEVVARGTYLRIAGKVK